MRRMFNGLGCTIVTSDLRPLLSLYSIPLHRNRKILLLFCIGNKPLKNGIASSQSKKIRRSLSSRSPYLLFQYAMWISLPSLPMGWDFPCHVDLLIFVSCLKRSSMPVLGIFHPSGSPYLLCTTHQRSKYLSHVVRASNWSNDQLRISNGDRSLGREGGRRYRLAKDKKSEKSLEKFLSS